MQISGENYLCKFRTVKNEKQSQIYQQVVLSSPIAVYAAYVSIKDNFILGTIVGDVIFHLWEIHDTLE
jgi:uncharacterized cysteine cluster protein YcgN (CxxCxxCC family)